MPNVGGVQYPYTPEGIAAAQQAQRQIQKTGPVSDAAFGPLTSPGLLDIIRQRQQPTFESVSHRPHPSSPMWYGGFPGNLMGGVAGPSLQDMLRSRALQEMMQQPRFQSRRPEQPTFQSHRPQPTNFSQLIGQLVRGLPQTPTPGLDPSRGAPRPQPTFGSISHRPPDVGGRSIQKMGPTIPASTNYRAISPTNRIAGNISAVMSGRPGPSPGTTPYLNESGRLSSPPGYTPNPYGPTGQLRPPRQPVQKGG